MFPLDTQRQQTAPQSFQSAPSQQHGNQSTPLDYLAQGPNMNAPAQYHWQIGDVQISQTQFLQQFREDLHSHYAHTASASDQTAFPHLHQTVMVDGKERRRASVQPADRAPLVKEAQDQQRALPYVSLTTPSFSDPDRELNLGRISSSPFNRGEQHYYNQNNVFTPYPQEGQTLHGMATGGVTEKQVWQSLHNVNMGQPPLPQVMEHEQELQSVPAIINLAETQRSPLMGALSNLEIANQAQKSGSAISFQQAFGQSQGGVNFPGTIAATGSGAVHQFSAFERSLLENDIGDENIQRKVTRAPKKLPIAKARRMATKRRDNILDSMNDRFRMTDLKRAMKMKKPNDRSDAVYMRLLSAAKRNSMGPMGLSRYNFRSLT